MGTSLLEALQIDDFPTVQVPCSQIVTSRFQVRKKSSFSDENQASLITSTSALGIIYPILLWRLPDGTLELIDGERRWRSRISAGAPMISARILVDCTKEQAAELAFDTHFEHKPLSVSEQAASAVMMKGLGWTNERIANKLHCKPHTVTELFRISTFPPEIQDGFDAGYLRNTHIDSLVRIQDPHDRLVVAQLIRDERPTADELRARVQHLVTPPVPPSVSSEPMGNGTTTAPGTKNVGVRRRQVTAPTDEEIIQQTILFTEKLRRFQAVGQVRRTKVAEFHKAIKLLGEVVLALGEQTSPKP